MKKSTVLLITVLFMLIGYAAYNTTVNIYGLGKLSENISDFKVYLSNLKVNGAEISGINNAKDEFTINDINGDVTVDIINASTEYDTEAYLECDKDNTWTFDYTGGEQTFTAPIANTYKLEVWGAQGGYGSFANNSNDKPGYGGYSEGIITLVSSSKLYVNVGGAGAIVNSTNGSSGGYNGGGNGESTCEGFNYPGGGGGGGATHISTISGLLSTLSNNTSNILIVAGGGGGAGLYNGGYNQGGGYAGSGGGFEGGTATTTNLRTILGGTQTSGYSFGLGKTSTACHYAVDGNWGNGGGGGGLFGGFASNYTTGSYTNGGGAGGSGYIGNSLLSEKSMYCYNCTESSEVSTKTISTTCVNEIATANCAKSGNGYARITLLSSPTNIETDKVTIIAQESNNQSIKGVVGKTLTCKLKLNKLSRTEKAYTGQREWSYDYTGAEQSFTAPVSGTYKFELWGAQGGNISVDDLDIKGGYGGYASGSIKLKRNDTIYISIAGKGQTTSLDNINVSGGYNGGGTSGYLSGVYETIWGSGGGATHIATKQGLLNSLENYKETILIVAGGGGGSGYFIAKLKEAFIGGSGGGFIGNNGEGTDGGYGFGGSQITGGARNNRLTAAGTFHGSGEAGAFGIGGSFNKSIACSGGGAGFYGGGSGHSEGSGAGGGSSYIGNPLLTNKVMYCYNCTESTEESTKTTSTTCTNENPIENCAKQGNGYAKITLISQD